MTMRAKRYQNSAALLIFMRRTTPVEPTEPVEPAEPAEPAEPLSNAIKGKHAPQARKADLHSKSDYLFR